MHNCLFWHNSGIKKISFAGPRKALCAEVAVTCWKLHPLPLLSIVPVGPSCCGTQGCPLRSGKTISLEKTSANLEFREMGKVVISRWISKAQLLVGEEKEPFQSDISRGSKSYNPRKSGCVCPGELQVLLGIALVVVNLMEQALEEMCSILTGALYLLCTFLVMILIFRNAAHYSSQLWLPGNVSESVFQWGFLVLCAYLTFFFSSSSKICAGFLHQGTEQRV